MAKSIKRNLLKVLLAVLVVAIVTFVPAKYVPIDSFKAKEVYALAPIKMLMAAAGVDSGFHSKAISLNGSNETMANTTDASIGIANAWTVICWVKVASFTSAQLFHLESTSGNEDFIALYTRVDGNMRANIFDSAGAQIKSYLSTNDPLSVDTIYSLTYTWNGTDLEFYFNTTNIAAGDINKSVDNSGTMATATRMVKLGGNTGVGERLNGELSAVHVWNVVLDSASRASLYDGGEGYKLDVREATGDYTETANLKHQWKLGKNVSPNIGEDFVASGGIDVETNSEGVDNTNIVTF